MLAAVDGAVQLVVDRSYKAGDPIVVWYVICPLHFLLVFKLFFQLRTQLGWHSYLVEIQRTIGVLFFVWNFHLSYTCCLANDLLAICYCIFVGVDHSLIQNYSLTMGLLMKKIRTTVLWWR